VKWYSYHAGVTGSDYWGAEFTRYHCCSLKYAQFYTKYCLIFYYAAHRRVTDRFRGFHVRIWTVKIWSVRIWTVKSLYCTTNTERSTSSVMSHVRAINKQNNNNITWHRTSLANEQKCERIIQFGSLSVVTRYYETIVCRARL